MKSVLARERCRHPDIPAEVDVVVVGGGGSGLAAAVSAAQRGVTVLLLEKDKDLGGTTALSVGSLTAAGTRLQRHAGIADSAAAFAEDMWAFDPERLTDDAPRLRWLLATEAGATVSWLEDLGVAFSGPYPEPPHRVPRMHNVIPHSRVYITRLAEAARTYGVKVVCGHPVTGLTRDGGSVTGVSFVQEGGRIDVRARHGVILATGDFSGNEQMRHQHLPAQSARALPINAGADGDGHRLGAGVGGQTSRMDVTFGPQLRFARPDRTGFLDRLPTWRRLCQLEAALVRALPPAALRPFVKSLLIAHMSPALALFDHGAILVNARGDRFCDEKESVGQLSSEPGGKGYIVMDRCIANTFNAPPHSISTAPGIAFAYYDDYRRGRPDLVHEADTPRDLASRCGLDADSLLGSISGSGLQAPFVALGPCYSMLTVTEGALSVDADLHVLDVDGAPVPGLYAVGGVGQGGMLLMGHGHHIGWAMTSGRLAGELVSRTHWS